MSEKPTKLHRTAESCIIFTTRCIKRYLKVWSEVILKYIGPKVIDCTSRICFNSENGNVL